MDDEVQVAVVLAGGGSRRLGRDKLAVEVGGAAALDRLLDGLVAALPGVPIVCAGPRRATTQNVEWCLEQPPGGGPAAGLASALADRPASGLVAVLAGDLPFGAEALPALTAAPAGGGAAAEAWLAIDPRGILQPLLGLYRSAALRPALARAGAGCSVRSLLEGLRVRSVVVPARALLDIDTEDDVVVVRAEAAARARGRPLA